jgi:hypothetical protein
MVILSKIKVLTSIKKRFKYPVIKGIFHVRTYSVLSLSARRPCLHSTRITSISVYFISRRSMHRVKTIGSQATNLIKPRVNHNGSFRSLVYSVNTPVPTTSSNTSLNSNPIVCFIEKIKLFVLSTAKR